MGRQDVKAFVGRQIRKIGALPDNRRRAMLADLRRGIGYAPGELPQLWGAFLEDMPEAFMGQKEASHEEWAVYIALTYYAMHRQGRDEDVNRDGQSIGMAVRELAQRTAASGQDWTESSVIRRFNALVTATDIREISHHMRGMIQLLRSAPDGTIPLDYPQLAADLYDLQCDDPRYANIPANVKLRWGQDLYRYSRKDASDETEEK